MNQVKHAAFAAAVAVMAGMSGSAIADGKAARAGWALPDLAPLAEKIVGKTANVKQGEIVRISGSPADVPFMEELAVAVRKRGAFPLLTIWSESLLKKMIAEVPAKYDGQLSATEMGLAKLVNVEIVIPAVRDESIIAALPADRQAATAKANAPIGDVKVKRNVRVVELSNGLAPSAARARALGVGEAELTRMYWDGLAADYAGIEDKAKTLQARLAKGGELHITLPNGTDLKMKLKGRKVLASDGVISDADVKAGGASVNTWLPAGEVYGVPVPGTAAGKLVDDRMLYLGKEILGVTAEIKGGKITSITAKSGWDAIKGRYDVAGAGKDVIGVYDFGINPAIKTGGKLETWVGAGTFTLTTGANVWAGGTNKEPFGFTFMLAGATVTLDGKPLIENGVLE